MVKDMIEVIFIITFAFIRLFLRLSTGRVDNLESCCLGHIFLKSRFMTLKESGNKRGRKMRDDEVRNVFLDTYK